METNYNNSPVYSFGVLPVLADCKIIAARNFFIAIKKTRDFKRLPVNDVQHELLPSLSTLPKGYSRSCYIKLNENLFAVFESKRTKTVFVYPCDSLGLVNHIGSKFKY